MKRYHFPIDKYQAEWIFAPIRTRLDAISILMRSLKIIIINSPPDVELADGEIILQVSKMSRIFFISKKKVFSMAFPFITIESQEGLIFRSSSHSAIDNKVSSEILSLLESPNAFTALDIYSFVTPIDEAYQFDNEIWGLFRDLLTSEEGYLRYDFDEKNENGEHHPLHHFDVFFSTNVTFKLGIRQGIDFEKMSDMLDSATACHYVGPLLENKLKNKDMGNGKPARRARK